MSLEFKPTICRGGRGKGGLASIKSQKVGMIILWEGAVRERHASGS